MQGKIAWRKELAPYSFDVAIGSSPVVYEDSVIVVCDLKGTKSSVYAFDGKTGAVKWETKRPKADWAHSTPSLAKVNGKMELLTATFYGAQGLDPSSGEVLWTYATKGQIGDTVTPLYRDGLLYVDSGRGGIGIAIDATGSGDISQTPLKWKIQSAGTAFSSPVLVGDYLYRLQGSDLLSCWKWATGESVFKERLEGMRTASSPIATADGRIYCASADRSYVVKAGPKLEILARNDLGDASLASPAVAAGRIYLKGGRYLWCIGAKKD
jgi:outer membrane protein assembly factor BamB